MTDKAFDMLNNAVIEFVVKHQDTDPVVATMQRAITELSQQTADTTLDLSKRMMVVKMTLGMLRVLIGYISVEYPNEFRTFPPVSGFTRR